MRHIFHTSLLALRLISSVSNLSAAKITEWVFDNGFMNAAIAWFYVDPGMMLRKENPDALGNTTLTTSF